VQQAEASLTSMGRSVCWHLIGHLQSNKAKKAAALFDIVQTIDSLRLAEALDVACGQLGKKMPIFIEVNSAEEKNKSGVLPDKVIDLAKRLSQFTNLQLCGLMTMGPLSDDPEDCRPFFIKTRELFDQLSDLGLWRGAKTYLSMGMSQSFEVGIEEGATMVRIGTRLFGPRLFGPRLFGPRV
jgi:hypothetical protein